MFIIRQSQEHTRKSYNWTRVRQSIIPDIVYEICFWCATNRNVGTLHIDYTAMVEFYFKQEEIKVPDKILKNHELTSTYMNAERIKEIGDVLTIIKS